MYKTYQPKAKEVIRNWHLVDAKGKVLGRLATDATIKLMGKHKANYSAHLDSGDYVVVINAKNIEVTGKKANQKIYVSHSGYPGGYKETKYAKLREESPDQIIRHAISGMLPENRLKKKRLARLKIFTAEEHNFKDKFKNKE